MTDTTIMSDTFTVSEADLRARLGLRRVQMKALREKFLDGHDWVFLAGAYLWTAEASCRAENPPPAVPAPIAAENPPADKIAPLPPRALPGARISVECARANPGFAIIPARDSLGRPWRVRVRPTEAIKFTPKLPMEVVVIRGDYAEFCPPYPRWRGKY